MGQDHEQLKNAILQRIYKMQRLHQRDIKAVVDEVKNHYLWDGKINLEDLKRATEYFKEHWRDLKEQAKLMRKTNSVIGFASYQF